MRRWYESVQQETRHMTLEETELLGLDFDCRFVDLDRPELCKRRLVPSTPYVAVCETPTFFWTALRKDGKPIDEAIRKAGKWTSFDEISKFLINYHSQQQVEGLHSETN